MNWLDFENYTCRMMSESGYWALRIPKNESGAQPFDVIAIKGNNVVAFDCKVCSTRRFPMRRIEDNQWLSFEQMQKKTDAVIGIMAYYNNNIYFIPYEDLLRNENAASILLDDKYILKSVN